MSGCRRSCGPLPPRLGASRAATRLRLRCRLRAFALGEVAALGDGRDVGPVVGENAFEDVAGFGRVVGVGDDVDAVVVAASGGGDVQASMAWWPGR